jgi:glycosyltransferase involved in cell wall biosynthesis
VRRSLLFLKFALQSIQIALTEPSDIVFATSTPLTAGIPGIVCKILTRKQFVFEVRDLWPELPRAMGAIKNPLVLGGMSVLEWITYWSSDHCIGLSPGIVEGIRRNCPASTPVTMIPNGCDLELFDRPAEGTARPTGVSPGDLMAVFTGTHGLANGLDRILDVAAELIQRHDGTIKFVFVGDGKCKPELKQRALEQSLSNCIFLDPMPKGDLAKLLHSADVGIMALSNVPAFYYGTSPNKFFDYLAASLPVVNNYPGWVADLLNEYRCGFVVPPDDPVKYADTLQQIYKNRSDLAEIRERCRTLGKSQFNRDMLSANFVKVLETTYKRQP